jgi:large subunit ribosomal protein L1
MGKMKTATVGEENTDKKKQHGKPEEEKVHISGLKGGQKIKMMDAETEPEETTEEKSAGKKVVEKVRSQKYQTSKSKIELGKAYPLESAIKLVKETSYSKFDGTMELHLVVKKVGTSIQITLPHSAGREKKVEVASDETIEKLKTGKIDFDILVATPDMMPKLVPFARILGPKGMMPNPKNGTLVTDPKKAKGFSASTKTIKTEREAPLIHTVVGKVSQADGEIKDNVAAILKALGGSKQILKAYLKSTMSPSVKVAV